ncbi:MAG: class I SAM-dependent methyltransferase, partial [Pseudomonadota bacterium]|nr:class I SAM-dependent methyltransferase [Pseudomonadota bacterium]
MSTIHSNIDDHYGGVDVCARIFEALENAGRDLEALTAEDLTPFDQFHGGGIASTRDLAAFSGIRDGLTVVDVGCGIGGPARTLAAEFGCRVIGV